MVADVDYPKGCTVAMSTIGIQKYFLLLNNCDTHVVELEPKISVVVFYVDEVVTTFCAAIVNADSMKGICALFIFNWRKCLVNFFV